MRWQKAFTMTSVGATLVLASAPAPAMLNLSDVPLFITSAVQPNIMLMLDNSGSMSNIVPEAPYDPSVNYIPDCPEDNLVPTNRQVELYVRTRGTPQGPNIGYDTNGRNGIGSSEIFRLGTTSGQRCFNPTAVYTARLNADDPNATTVSFGTGNSRVDYRIPAVYLPATYTGNYLNWYFNPGNTTPSWGTQSRKPGTQSRILIARAAGIDLVNSLDDSVRVGLSTYNNGAGGRLLEPVATLNGAQRSALISALNGLMASGSTPLAETLAGIGRYFATGAAGNLLLHPDGDPSNDASAGNCVVGSQAECRAGVGTVLPRNLQNAGTTAPVVLSCQRSFAVLLTDGRPQNDRSENGEISPFLEDYDGDCVGRVPACATFDRKPAGATGIDGLPYSYESQGSDYLDDVAQALFEIDLRPDFPVGADGNQFKNNVTTYLIGFADEQVANDPLVREAAQQGGGEFFTAENTNQLSTAFSSIVSSIFETAGTFSSVAANSTRLDSDTRIYQARFNSANWLGELRSFPIRADGTICVDPSGASCPNGAEVWDAGERIPLLDERRIYTLNPSATAAPRGVEFLWDNLTLAQQTALSSAAHVDYLRGSAAQEQRNGGDFRNRVPGADDAEDGVRLPGERPTLGDIVNSDPTIVGLQNFGFSVLPEPAGSTYTGFLFGTASTRRPVVYVGANDGMLHAFDATSGVELFAYVPNDLIVEGVGSSPLLELTEPAYQHRYYVDGSARAGDAYVDLGGGATWHTLLIGALGLGGRGIFALDVTDPDQFDASSVLWEFTDEDDPDMGFGASQPSLVRLANGDWGVVVNNGYNSASQRAVVFILDAVTGAVIRKFDTGVGSSTETNGAAPVFVADENGDRIADRIFFGDLRGNLWEINIQNSDPDNWNFAYRQGQIPQPLFTACTDDPCTDTNRQPITSRPEVGRGPNGANLLVYFGTGQYLEPSDVQVDPDTRIESFYGILSADNRVSGRNDLQEQRILVEEIATLADGTSVTETTIRLTTSEVVDYNAPGNQQEFGWYLDLALKPTANTNPTPTGERVISTPLLRNGRILFTTLIPQIDDPCSFGGTSFLMILDAESGSAPRTVAIDLNGDGLVNQDDAVLADITGDGQADAVPASGRQSRVGIVRTPAVVGAGNRDLGFTAGTADPAEGGSNNTEGNTGSRPDGIEPFVLDAAGARGRESWRQLQ